MSDRQPQEVRWRIAPAALRRLAQIRRARPPTEAVTTLVATAMPRPRPVLSRRVFVLGGFWSGLALAIIGVLGSPLGFVWPRPAAGFGGKVTVRADKIPPPGAEPVHIWEGRFYTANLAPGQEGSPGGLLAIWHKCTHLGCTVPWRPDFVFEGSKGWYRCPCHGSTYTRGAAIRVYGPAPRPLDLMEVTVLPNGDVEVNTGRITKGSGDNAQRVVPYPPRGSA